MQNTEQNIAIARHIMPHARIPYLNMPDYLNDLNAMHEAEKVLNDHQWDDYICQLGHAMGATAAQRAEAFLKTLNLWTG